MEARRRCFSAPGMIAGFHRYCTGSEEPRSVTLRIPRTFLWASHHRALFTCCAEESLFGCIR